MTHSLRHLISLALAGALAACAGTPAPRDGAMINPPTPLDQYRAQVIPQADEVRLAIHAQGISGPQADALAGLLNAWRANEGGPLKIQAPVGAGDSAATYRMGESVRAFLVSQGAPHTAIQLAGYDAAGFASAPMVVGYERYVAQIPQCGQSWENLTSTSSNQASANFGCAVSANFAAQLANPADMVRPRDMEAPDAARRSEVLAKYRLGEITATRADEQAKGALSQVVR
ncbi:CpaD family pilus assembly protein [Phenylobacterium sp.]|uniref:CpaD family pilus assembly protein n=1 Tax=Phenylobacterium sp. TaxID=1871053 RepID=UPI0027319A4D|nr:CpaD family pilus assembly protein [Phenylobacterium sp.]MDP2215384.1 CpaD family pilus assembly protein [Phenylobacterium sp.]